MLNSFANATALGDTLASERATDQVDGVVTSGLVVIEWFRGDGTLRDRQVVHNLITQVGDQFYGERAAGIGGAPGAVTGMRLGTGTTAVAKTGAGAAIVTYKTGSYKAIDGTYPQSSLNGSSRRIQWKTSWGAGVVNGSALAEAVITNESPLTDVAGTASNTISRALFGPITLGASDTLSITWNHDLLGA